MSTMQKNTVSTCLAGKTSTNENKQAANDRLFAVLLKSGF
jgi:hypothetical protein